MGLTTEQKDIIHQAHVTLDHIDADSAEMEVTVRIGGVEIATARIDPLTGDVDLIDPPDDEQLIRHFGLEATKEGDDPEFEADRSQFEAVLATRIRTAQMLGFPPALSDDLATKPATRSTQPAPGIGQ